MLYLILALIFAVFVALFAVQNASQITVTFLAWQWNTSVAVIILGAAACGALFGGMLAIVREVQLKLKLRNMQSQVNRLDDRLEEAEIEKERLEALLAEKGSASGLVEGKSLR
ncbi:MAG: LapA family protein [Firmicutes bacterium]|nr:LapA family protein [Bacillota bacterium]